MAVLQAGCVGIPFATPPTRIELGSGFRKVDGFAQTAVTTPTPRGTRGQESRPATDHPAVISAGVYPLGFGRQLLHRNFDVGVGYTYQGGPSARIHGGFLEGQGMLGQWTTGPNGVFRAGVRARLSILGEERFALLGRGATFGGFIEVAQFATGEFGAFNDKGGAVGVSAGEGGIGLAVDANYAQVDQLTVTSLTGSITIRIPIVAGFAFAWLWALDKK